MAIRFRCHHCKRILSAKEEAAGKGIRCPGCKKPILIPTPQKNISTADPVLEEIAAEALVGEESLSEGNGHAGLKIEMTCPYCDEQVSFDAELGGKRAPCPSCTRIIRVDELPEKAKQDWRRSRQQGPSGALLKQNIEEKLEGAWGTVQDRAFVSRDTLLEVDAIKKRPKEPVSVRTWVARGIIGAVAAVLLVIGIMFAVSYLSTSRVYAKVDDALANFEQVQKEMSPEWAAEFHHAVAKYYLALHKGQVDKALKHLRIAWSPFGAAGKTTSSPQEELFLIDVAVTQAGMGGEEGQVNDGNRISWSDVQRELGRILSAIQSPEGRLLGLRRVSAELFRLNQQAIAIGLANQLGATSAAGNKEPTIMAAGRVGLMMAVEQDQAAKQVIPPPKGDEKNLDLTTRLAYAQGYAHKGKFEEARKIAGMPGNGLYRFQAMLAVAEIALEKGDMAEAQAAFKEVEAMVNAEPDRIRRVSPILLYELVSTANQVASPETARNMAKLISDAGCLSRAELDILLKEAHDADQPLDPTKLSDKNTISYAWALVTSASQHARRGTQSSLTASQEGGEATARPLILIGLALGGQ